MSKSKKIAIIVSVVFIAAGVIILLGALTAINFDFSKINFAGKSEAKVYEITDDFENINIQGVECDVVFLPSEDGKCKVEAFESEKITNDIEVKDNTLIFTRIDNRAWYEHIGIYWQDFSITVYLPKTEYNFLSLETVSGDISIPFDFSFSSSNIVTTSGDILFEARTDGGLSVKNTSGNVNLKNSVDGKIEIINVSGNVSYENMFASDIYIQTTSGDIYISSSNVLETADVISNSGKVTINGSDATSFYIKTVSGDIFCQILSSKIFDVRTDSGSVNVPESDFSSGIFNSETNSGDIRVEVLS